MAAMTPLEQVMLKPVEMMADKIPILVKYNQDEIATRLYHWIFDNEDAFLREFAVPNVCFWTQRLVDMGIQGGFFGPDDITDGFTVLPCTPAMFHQTDATGTLLPLTDAQKRFLKRRPFRVRTLRVTTQMDGDLSYDAVQFVNDDYLFGFIYCEYDDAQNFPRHLSREIYDTMLRSALQSFSFLPEKDPTLVSMDLYLDRVTPQAAPIATPGIPQVVHGWHSDSDAPFGDREDAMQRVHVHKAENVEYVHLGYIMPPEALGRSVTMIVNEPTRHDLARASPFTEPYRNAITLPTKLGTVCVMNNRLLFHSSPSTMIPAVTLQASGLRESTGAEDVARISPTPLDEALTDDERIRLLQPTQRCFFRVHYTGVTKTRYQYRPYITAVPDQVLETQTMPLETIGIPRVKPNAISVPVNTTADGRPNLSQINYLLGQRGPLQRPIPASPATEEQTAHPVLPSAAFGGTLKKRRFQRKTRRIRGGAFDTNNFIIQFHVTDYYYFDKYSNTLIVIT